MSAISQTTTSSNAAEVYPMTPHKKYWFDTGDLILIVDSVGFKVHQGLLAETVPGVLESEDSGCGGELMASDGCRCIELQETENDIVHFLGAIYDDLYFSYRRGFDFVALEAVYRLATNYHSERLGQVCLNRILLDWPTSLSGWDTRERLATNEHGQYHPRDFFCIPTLIIEFATCDPKRLAQFSPILPAALYDLCRYRAEKTPSITDYPKQLPPSYATCASKMKAVSGSTMLRQQTQRGRDYAIQYMPRFIKEQITARKPCTRCLHRNDPRPGEPCIQTYNLLNWYITKSIAGELGGRDADPLWTLNLAREVLGKKELKVSEEKTYRVTICGECRKDMVDVCSNARAELWNSLPRWFGL